MKKYSYIKSASEPKNTNEFHACRNFVAEVLNFSSSSFGSDYLRGNSYCIDPNDLHKRISYDYAFESVDDIESLAKELLPVYSKYIQKILSIADKYNAPSHASNSSQGQISFSPDSVLIDNDFVDKLFDALSEAGVSGEDTDIATNNLYHEYKDSYIDRDDLVDELISKLFDAAKGSGLARDELGDVYGYFADVVPDAVNSVFGQ